VNVPPSYVNYVGPPLINPPNLQYIVMDSIGRQWQYGKRGWRYSYQHQSTYHDPKNGHTAPGYYTVNFPVGLTYDVWQPFFLDWNAQNGDPLQTYDGLPSPSADLSLRPDIATSSFIVWRFEISVDVNTPTVYFEWPIGTTQIQFKVPGIIMAIGDGLIGYQDVNYNAYGGDANFVLSDSLRYKSGTITLGDDGTITSFVPA